MSTRIPSLLKVGGNVFEIEMVNYKDMPTNVLGEFNLGYNKIKIVNDIPISRQWETLLHEIVEILSGEMELEMTHPQVTALAYALFQVFSDNNIDFS